MSSRNNILRIPRFIRRVVACALACALVLTTLVSVPALAAEPNVGTTLMGLRVWDSSKDQHSGADGQPGSVKVELRVTNSNSTEPVKVTVIFNGNGGSWPGEVRTQTISVELFKPTVAPEGLDYPGYDFVGWFLDGNAKVDPLPTSTVESAYYVAHWELHTYDIKYEIAAGGTNHASNPATYDVTKSIELADATPPTGYQFDGWTCEQLNITQAAKNPKILAGTAKDLTFVAHFSPAKYKVTFDSTGGSEVKPKEIEVEYGSKVTKPTTDPTRPGYKFEAWYKNKELTEVWDFDTDTMPANEMILYAKWSEHIECEIPISTVFQIDAKGDVTDITGKSHEFVSGTDAPIVVTSATSELLAGANTLFPDEAARKGVAILIKPEGGVQKSIPLPTATPATLGWRIEEKKTLPVTFGLHLPATARLNYLANDGTAEIASISYTVSLATL